MKCTLQCKMKFVTYAASMTMTMTMTIVMWIHWIVE